MRPLLLDTNAYAAFKRGDAEIIEMIRHVEVLGISPIVLGELLSGFALGTQAKKNRDELQQFLQSSRIRFFPLTSDTAHFYSQIYLLLRSKGKPIPTNDLWIGAQALENGCLLCSYDKHFKAIEGLIVGTTLVDLML